MTSWSPADDSWFAGFADGEACFLISKCTTGGCYPRFGLSLRADDLAILERLQEAFGGRISMETHEAGNPSAHWYVVAKREMAGLVQYFDAHPLRAKKARDYSLWRRAVSLYCEGGRRADGLTALRDALMLGRRFEAHDELGAAMLPLIVPQLQLSS